MGSKEINLEVESIKNVLRDQTCSNCGTDRKDCIKNEINSCTKWSLLDIEEIYLKAFCEEFDKRCIEKVMELYERSKSGSSQEPTPE